MCASSELYRIAGLFCVLEGCKKMWFRVIGESRSLKAAQSVTFDLLILEIMFLFFKNTAKKLKFRYIFDQFRKI